MPPKRIVVSPLVGLGHWSRSTLVGSHCCCKKNKKNRSAINKMNNGSINTKKTLNN
jgi:hypothetical protein